MRSALLHFGIGFGWVQNLADAGIDWPILIHLKPHHGPEYKISSTDRTPDGTLDCALKDNRRESFVP
jgi:hypothetical protein